MGDAATIVIRPAEVRDYAAYARLYPELESQSILTSPVKWERHECSWTLIAELNGRVVGYLLWTMTLRRGAGHISQLVVDPEVRRRQIGTHLLLAAGRRLSETGCVTWTINLKAKNTAALRLYERLGFRRASMWHELAVPWEAPRRMPRQRGTRHLSAGPKEDLLLAALFGLNHRMLAQHRRESPENVILSVIDEREHVAGVGAFAPDGGLCRALAVRHPGWAGPLIAAMSQHRERGAKVFLVELHEGPLSQMLRRAGARPVLAVLEMEGVIPRRSLP